MIITTTGKIGPDFYVLGTNRMPSYLLDGSRPILFEAGLSCLGPAYKEGIMKILGGRQPEILFLTHVHYDHCGSVAFLKKAFPGMKVAGSKRAAEIIIRPGALRLIGELNRAVVEVIRKWFPAQAFEETFQPFVIDWVLSDGDRIQLEDGRHVEVLATPGHTWDSLSYYLPKEKILIASESVGCPDNTGFIFTEFLVDYQAYLESIDRLSRLEVEIFCPGHGAVYTGEEARGFFDRSRQAAREFKELVEDSLHLEGKDIQKTIARVKAIEYDPKPGPKQLEAAYLLNIEARVRHLATMMEKKAIIREKE